MAHVSDPQPSILTSKARGITVVVTLAGVSFLNTMGSGILNAALPRIAHDVGFTPVLFTASNLVISDAFPADVQSLAGGVFNEVAQFGNSVGLAVTAAIAASVTEHPTGHSSKEAIMEGFRAAFWTVFAATFVVVIISYFGLRKEGTVGKKDD